MSEGFGGGRSAAGGGREVVRLLLGLVDVGLEQAEYAAHAARGLLGRSDLAEMAAEVRAELGTRGDALLGRVAPSAESHMEALARIAQAGRRQGADA
ncbi:MAG TPA: hypothetical protein VH372_02220 [Actinospica sp.]|jgi:hypothetical protein|nr:hypothetical protein [Actinospica sp.]